jgi:hypothetical protein
VSLRFFPAFCRCVRFRFWLLAPEAELKPFPRSHRRPLSLGVARSGCQGWPLLRRPPAGLVLDSCEHGGSWRATVAPREWLGILLVNPSAFLFLCFYCLLCFVRPGHSFILTCANDLPSLATASAWSLAVRRLKPPGGVRLLFE